MLHTTYNIIKSFILMLHMLIYTVYFIPLDLFAIVLYIHYNMFE